MAGAVIGRALRATFGPRVWAILLYGVLALPLGLFGLGYALVVLGAAAVFAVPPLRQRGFRLARLLAGGLAALADLHRRLAGWLLDMPVVGPTVTDAGQRHGGPRPAAVLTDRVALRTIAYLLVKTPLWYVQFWICAPAWAWAGVLMTFPLWWRALPPSLTSTAWRQPVRGPVRVGDVELGVWPHSLLVVAAGLILLLAAPWISRIVLVDGLLVRLLLGRSATQRLRETRALAVDGSAAALRRIERDLHDGAQAHLVALAMRLGMAREELAAGDVAAALPLVESAHTDAKQVLGDLRSLARGIHPAALDAGLAAALETLAARSAIPVELRVELDHRPSAAIETIAYFSAAELLTNVAKHSGARRALVRVERAGRHRLRLIVRDDGCGGARLDGSGLSGLVDRAGTVDGRVSLHSPPGGPTVISVDLPMES